MEYPDMSQPRESAAGPQLLEIAVPAGKTTDLDELCYGIQDWLYSLGIPAQLHSEAGPVRPRWYSRRQYVTRWSFFGRHIQHEVGTAWVIGQFYMAFTRGTTRFIRER